MIGREEFQRRLPRWLDGELPGTEADEMEAFCASDDGARAQAAAERAFDDRLRRALLADADGRRLVADALRRARAESDTGTATHDAQPAAPAAAAARPRARVFRLPYWLTGGAAAAAIVGGVMWFNCIPPFGCEVLRAMEDASRAPAEGTEEYDGRVRERVPVTFQDACHVYRCRVDIAGRAASILVCPAGTPEPTWRVQTERFGDRWWIGADRGDRLVAFRDPADGRFWCFVGPQPEETLLAAAREFRDERARAQK